MSKLFTPEELTLSNGIPVLFQNFDGPVASIYWWINTGSADEKPKEAGFAHFLEHMHFKDTDAKASGKASTGALARAIESFGGDVNAYTSFDQTVYHVTVASHHWEKILDVFGEMARPQRFLKEDFVREREVILEELKRGEDSPNRMLFQDLFSNVYSKHPYGRPVIGFARTLKAATVSDLEAFYRRQYVTGNMGLVLVGPFDETRKKKILSLLEKRFGSKVLKKKPAYSLPRATEKPENSKLKFSTRKFDVKTPSACIAFRIPDLKHEDLPAIDLLASVLAMGEMSRLYQRLFYKDSLVTDVNGGTYVPKDPGMLYFALDCENLEKLEPAFQGLCDEIRRIQEHGPTDEEIARVAVNQESERFYAAQTADGVAGRLGFLKFQVNDREFDRRYLDAIRSATPDQLRVIAEKYLTIDRMTGAFMVPKTTEGFSTARFEEIAQETLTATKKSATATTRASKKSSSFDLIPEKIRLSSGATILYRDRPNSHLMSIYSAVLGGTRRETVEPVRSAAQDLGASPLLAATWNKGTQTKTAKQITSIIEGSAASMDGFAGRNTVGLTLVGLARDWSKLSSLYQEVLLEPSFREEELAHIKRLASDTIRGIEDHSSALCSKLFMETLFENHPYGKFTQGTLESVEGMDTATLKEFHRRWVQPENLVVSMVGNINRKDFEEFLKRFDDSLNAFSSGKSRAIPEVPGEKPLLAPRWVERKLGREQVHLLTGGLGLKLGDEDRLALRVLSNILGGQSGRLFIELREKKSLAYSVAPVSMEGMENGYVGTYIACSPGKREEAVAGMRKVIEDLVKKGPTEKEMRRAKEFYLGRRAMDLQGDSSLASYFTLEEVYRLPFKTEAEVAKSIEKVSPRDVCNLARRLLLDAPLVTSTVG